MIRAILVGAGVLALAHPAIAQHAAHGNLDALIAKHASANGLPLALVHRVIVRESHYNPQLVGRGGAMGLMQIKVATARGLGYTGSAAGLLDAETNLTYAVRYLAGAYRVAGGNPDRAISYYQHGYYYAAKRARATARHAGASKSTAVNVRRLLGLDDPAETKASKSTSGSAAPGTKEIVSSESLH